MMDRLDIHIKNVGQGDTIFLHWGHDQHFGLIDCNLVDNRIDCVTKHIERYRIREFEFIILSHPHYDHFSGFLKLFEYCEQEGIIVKQFIHTAIFNPVRLNKVFRKKIEISDLDQVLASTVTRRRHRNALRDLFAFLGKQRELRPNGCLKAIFTTTMENTLYLNNNFTLRFLAPLQDDEHDRYLNETFEVDPVSLKITVPNERNNPHANLLSSLLQVSCRDNSHQVLLCSDVTTFTLDRLRTKKFDFSELAGTKLSAVQVPHHGSPGNHSPVFWEEFTDGDETHFIISVGEGYGHPGREVVGYFHSKTGKVYATNYVGGFREFFDHNITYSAETQLVDVVFDIMNTFDDRIAVHEKCKDHVISITEKDNQFKFSFDSIQCE